MRIHSRTGAFVALIALSVLVAACPGDPPPNIPTSPAPDTVTNVEISGPDSIAPGQSVQYTVALNLSSFVSKLPRSVKWFSLSSAIQINQLSGVATGGQDYGTAALIADVTLPDGKVVRTFKVVLNIPDGTFFLHGLVTDAELHPLPIQGARVVVIPGKVEGTTDSSGFYRMYGVPPNADVQITAGGYHTLTQTLDLFGHGRQDFRLALSGPRLTLNGFYTLSIDGGVCANSQPLPAELRSRQYDATVTQTGQTVEVRLTEPRFSVVGGTGNRFSGEMRPTGAQFYLQGFVNEEIDQIFYVVGYPNLTERLPDGTLLTTVGNVLATGSAAGLSGTLGGSIENFSPVLIGGLLTNSLRRCDSPRFTLTPR